MRERATDIARGMNAADRPKYLPKAVRGVPLRALALDDDEEFRHVEQERARAVCASGHEAEAAALEARLLARAVELASLHLRGDRAFLDQNPEGIPLAVLKVDDDDLFRSKEEQRASLLGDGLTEANRFAIAVFEESMNQQVHDMAKRLKALLIGQHVPGQVRGIPREVIPLLADERSSEIIAELTLCALDTALVKQVALLKARAEELVDASIEGIRSRLDVAPVHVQLSYLPLDEDESFKTLEIEALVEVQKPKPDAATVQDLIGALNCRARELAEQLCWEERKALMDSNPEGRALRSLPLNTDTIFLSAEAKHRAEAKVESSDAAALRVLMEEMAARAQQLALEANRKDRVSFVSAVVRGVALHDLPLDDDDAFRELERKRAMALQDPKQLTATVPAIEEALRSRADALAMSVLRNDRTFLDSRPEGVPLRQVPIDSDRRFQQLEEQRAQLRTSFREAGADFSTEEVKAIERMMNERVHEMANGVKPLLRNQLAQTVLGISLKDLPLDTDAVFNETEERCRDAEAAGDDKAATALKSDLNARATTLAEAMHKAERAALWQVPEGVPLEALPLNSDDVFLDLEREARLIRHIAAAVPSRHQRSSDVTKLAALIAELNRRACILANESRLAYCDAEPEGIPLETLQLASQPEFIGKEEERRHLVKTHGADSDPVRSCNAELRKMAYTIARSRVQGDRSFLDSDPEGVPLSVLPLDEDAAFHSMEVERARLKAQNTSAAASKAKALEEKLNERAHDLARLQKEEDLRGIDPAPHGIPLAVLQPHSDGTFASMVDLLRALKLESPVANADKICGLQADMNGRCLALAKSRVADDRAFLDADPEGVPLVLLPLDMDAAFQELEAQRANLKSLDPIRNAAAVKELEDRLNERAHELAMDHIAQELDGLTPEPFDVPLEVLRPYEDPSFKQAVAALRQLHTTNKADPTVASIKAAMEERCQAMAHDLLEKDRGYLHDRPKNVSLSLLPLNSDEAFHAGEVRRALLKAENARRNADKITELEGQLNLRAMELAELRRTQDMVGLDAEPEGVPLRVIDPHADAAFAALVEKRRALEVEQPASKTPSPQLAQVVSAMNCRAHELAKGILEGDRRYLDQDPEGVPLEVLPFDTDKVFHAMEVERAAMKAADPKRNAGRIRELEEKLNDRAHELAQVQKDEELCGLDPTPRGISLKLLRPHEDPLFSELVKQMRVMKKNPPRDDQEMVRHLEEMNARAAALADKVMDRGYLDPNPEGVPLQELLLETDDKFRSMEMERARLKLTDPRGQSAMISSLESALNQRAEELAKRQCVADLASVEDAPLEIAKELLRLHSDAEGATLIEDLRQLRKNPGHNAGVLRQKEAALNDRAFEVARKLLVGDRANYIDPRPRNIPLEDLPLEKDEMFHALEVERVVLKLTDPIHNAAAVRNTESTLNDRAYQLAELVMKEDLAGFPPSYHGILTKDLNPHSDRIFSETAEKRRFRIRVPTVTFKEDLEQIMDDRLSELARERKDGELYFMNPSPEGVLLADLPLSTDTLFNNMCQERQQLKEKDAMENRKAVVTLEDEMNKRAAVLARSVLNSDFDGVDKAPLGIPLDLLRPRQNAEVARLIPELRRCKRAAQLKNKVAGLQAKMNECVRVLAAAALEEGRDKYLDAHPEGVPLELLPLRTDDVFHDKEAQRATLRLQDPVKHAGAITQLESQLNAQAHKLALRQKEEDLVGVDVAPRGIPLAFLHPHEDAKMMGFIKDVRVLKTDPLHNKDNIRWQQQQMNERAHELATLALNGDREYLRPNPLGVSLTVLPLDEDPAFHEAEVARVVAKRQPHPNSKAIALLEQQLNARAEELAAAQLQCDVEGLEQAPLGVPLSLLKPHADSTFAELLPELRRLEKDPARNATKLKQLRAAANECNYELAEAFLAKDRSTYMGAEPEGVPLHLLKLTADDEFKALENKRLQLHSMQQAGRTVNAKDFSALEALLKERAHEVAKQLLRKDRGYLDPFPEGVALDILPLDSDPAFRRLETTRAAAKYRNTNTQANDLEDQLNARARELALVQKEEDLRGLDQHPHDLPLTLLQPHQDAQFEQLVDELRRLKASHGDQRKAVKEVQDRLNNRSYAMADRVTKGDRRYLHPKPENVPLSRLPLGTDATFHALEIERAMLKLKEPRKNQHRIADMEDQLNSRAAELAKAVKMEDLKSLAQTPRGIPVELLKLHEDPKFSALIAEKEQLPKGRSGEVTATLLNSMNECALEVADKLLRGDRGYLNRELEGALLPCLPLDTDMVFHEMEVERAKLKVRDPVKNASVIDDLEDQLTKRAHELMSAILVMDRDYLNPSPEGVPIEELLLDTDSKFHSMEVERAKLKVRDLQGNAARIKDLEGYLNDHAAGLAKQQLEEDLKGLDREPEGYPLKCLRPHSDAAFAAVVVTLRRAKMEPLGNVAKVHEAQATLNARAHELARERIAADRARLNQEPEKVPLALLPLEKDAQFVAVEKELRMLKAADKPNLKAITEVEGQMNDRAHVLARAYLKQSRDFLDQEPEGVALDYVPLDKDTYFCALERDRLCLLAKGASLSSAQVRAMEERLNDRAHELAAKVKTKGRDFLRSQSSDIPKELLALDADKVFVAKEKELRKHQQQPDGPHSLNTVANLRRELQQRADEVSEAQLKGDRGKYLDLQPEGVDLCDIPLDTDHIYHGMEVERAILLADDVTGRKPTVAELEKKLNTRAHELAHQIIVNDRYYLPEEVYGIPVEELLLATDSKFNKLERQRRVHKRSSNMRKEVAADEEELRCHAQELAKEVIALDLEPIKAFYRGIPKVELNLHADSAFRELAKKRRRLRGKGRVEATEMAAIEDEMDRRACEIADDVINNERAFLDPEPEGMYLIDVPLDDDQAFQQLEQEYRRRRRDPRTAKQNGSVLRELAEEMNQRSHTLARATFAKTRGFMKQEPEGIPLVELGLDEDPEFKEAEIARYRTNRSVVPNAATVAEMEVRMDGRARELARATLAADRAFLDPKPEGVSLEVLPLDSDMEFSDLARERRRRKKILKGGVGEAEVRAVEEKMNARSHEMAKEFLEMERAFLSREPEGVPLADLPLNADPLFRTMENERLRLKRDPLVNTAMLAAKEADLEHRAHVIAKDLLRKERAFLDPEPLSVPLEELPLNYDDVLNPVERKRRVLRMHPKRNHAAIRTCEEQMADRVGQIAVNFVDKERGFLDQNPEGVPLRYLPLNTDREFHEKELHCRKLRKRPEKNCGEIADTERKMNERVHALAKDLVLKGRAFLHPDPCGVPIADVPLNEDEYFRKMEEQRRALKEAGRSVASVKAIEEKLNDRAEKLAQRQLDEERSFMDRAPLGIPLHELPLNTDQRMREIERTRRQLRKSDSKSGAVDMSVLEAGMNARAHELADQLLSNDRGYLHPEPCGVPLADLPLHTDCIFHEAELARFRAKKNCQTDLVLMEKELNKRAMELAAEFIQKERAYLNQEPEGIPLDRLPLDTDPTFHGMELERRRLKRSGENPPQVLELEDLLNRRVHELAMELRGWQDPEFHEANEHVAEQWVRVCDLYPEGRYGAFIPTNPAPDDVFSAPQDVGYLVPFIAALSRYPVLLQRVIATEETPVNAPYTFIFFDPHSNPVYVDVDDRVPCTQAHEPKFVQSPCHLWWPLLLEKAYAKFVGGYERLNNCTSLETLRDLTGRPVTHTPFDMKLAEAASLGKYTSVDFWLGVAEDMARGDVVVCSSNAEVPDGIHPLCSYALIGVVVTVEGSTSPSDVVIKLENSYRNDEPFYTGPLCHRDANWSLMLQRVCQYDPERDDILYLPLPTFLRNFSSMQTCHINCGDRLTVTGTWDSRTSGGNSKFTSFRNNPIFVLQNSSSRPATVLSELRHATPEFVDPEGCSHYPQSGIVLMEPTSSSAPLTPLITNSTACFLQRGVMLDSREVCSVMEIPANSTCFLIPYTSKAGEHGSFFLSVYPGFAKVSLTPLHYCGLSREPKSVAVTLTPGAEGRRVDFTVSSACDVHVLLRQEKMTNRLAAMKGDAIAEDDVVMVAFNDQAMKLTSSGDATNAREHSLVFRADKPGYYSLLLTSPNQPVTGDNPCTVSIFTPKRVMVKFVPPPAGARPLRPTRFPVLPRGPATAAGGSNPRRLRGASTARQPQPQREATLPLLRKNGAGTPSAGFLSLSGPFSCSC
ncbi:Calpain family cysteine protease/Calpain large subunit, domain III, putative [Leishmania shawi]|uniref:Calpain family cysteine protease/Calpain large subunit, domain III n=1 Tax=Leishmania shawi TaxID=5680 RepID=A0ABR3EG02_9TRYP